MTGAASTLPSRIIAREQSAAFQSGYNQTPFQFSHTLAEHPLFDIVSIVALSEFLSRGNDASRCLLYTDDAHLRQGWNRAARPGATVRDCLENIQDSHSWMMLKDVQTHPAYCRIVDQFLAELEEVTRQSIRPNVTWMDAYMIVSSPGMLTPYHFDHESNFLLQIRGDKTVNLFDGADRSLLTEPEIEKYYIGDFDSARYQERAQAEAKVFQLEPGLGVHQPPLAPHWVRTGTRWSVSLAVLFFLRDYDQTAKVYQFNHYLRRLGLRPQGPGISIVKDALKQLILSDMGCRPRDKAEILRLGLGKYGSPFAFASRLLGQRTAKLRSEPWAPGDGATARYPSSGAAGSSAPGTAPSP
jgi:hypothetical protein